MPGQTQLLPGSLKNLFFPPEQDEYTYFARAGTRPFAGGSLFTKTAWAADASMLAYARYGERRMTDAELRDNFQRGALACKKIGNWDAPGTQAVFAHCPGFAILAFRGTDIKDPADTAFDVNLLSVPEPPLSFPPCLVHAGFQLALMQVWSQVRAAVAEYRAEHPAAEICFTGHSLGAALATLAFSRLEADRNRSLYTFGSPRVGNGAFCDRLLSHPGLGAHRVVNFNDTVTHVPAAGSFYHHVPAQAEWFDEHGNPGHQGDDLSADCAAVIAVIRSLPLDLSAADLAKIPAPNGLVDHSVARYCIRLWDCV